MKVTQHGNNFVFTTDITAQRHRGSSESIAVAPSSVAKRQAHEKILGLLRIRPMCSKEICKALGLGDKISLISGRLSELKAMGKIQPTGERRENSAVLRIV